MAKKPDMNEPCYCGLNRPYGLCHAWIDDAPPALKYAASQMVYSRNWATSSEQHFSKGYYHWMAEQLKPYTPSRFLDIGCGSGHGLLAIEQSFGSGSAIVALDENASCLDIAAETLSKGGVQARVIRRLTTNLVKDAFYTSANPVPALDHPVTLIESDVCSDPLLVERLEAEERFDAVTVWLTGVHMLRPQNALVKHAEVRSEADHRLFVQNSAYELADIVLRPGGVLQIVDRWRLPITEAVQEDLLEAHREQAMHTDLIVKDLKFRGYTEAAGLQMPIGSSSNYSDQLPPSSEGALVSIISVKL